MAEITTDSLIGRQEFGDIHQVTFQWPKLSQLRSVS